MGFTSIQAKMLILNPNNKALNQSIQNFKVTKEQNKSVASEFQIVLNETKIKVAIVDDEEGLYPLLRLKGTNLYAVHATSGSAGRYYHYFKINEGKTHYLGFYPELIQSSENQFMAFEKDGPRSIETTYELTHSALKTLNQVIIQ